MANDRVDVHGSMLTLPTNGAQILSAVVYDLIGNQVNARIEISTSSVHVDLTHLSNGMYLVVLQTPADDTIVRNVMKH